MPRVPQVVPGRRCGWPDRPCKAGDDAHRDLSGTRLPWGYHDIQCQHPNPRPVPDPGPAGPAQCTLPGYLDGYPVCALADGHAGDCDYRRHAAEAVAS